MSHAQSSDRASHSLAWSVATLTALAPLAGCYSYRPVIERGALAPTTAVALRVTDAGRVQLASRFGDGVRTIEGQLTDAPDSTYRLQVTAVQYIDGRVDKWTGERVQVPASAIGIAETRALSKSRTTLAAVIATATVVVFIISRSLGVFGGVGTQSPTGGGQQQS
jgi:hypothetical protein